MSLNSALYTGVSGLSAYGNAISIIGNNIRQRQYHWL